MADTKPNTTINIRPAILTSFGIEGDTFAVEEVRTLLNTFTTRFQDYLHQLPTAEQEKLSPEQRQILDQTQPSQLWFEPRDLGFPLSEWDKRKARFLVEFFDDVFKRLAAPAVEAAPIAAEAEAQEGGETPEPTPPVPTQLMKPDEIWLGIRDAITDQVVTQLTNSLDLTEWDEQQQATLRTELAQRISILMNNHLAELLAKMVELIEAWQVNPNPDIGAPWYDEQTQRYVITLQQIELIQQELLAMVIAAYGTELNLAVTTAVTIAAPPPPPPAEEVTAGETGAAAPGQAAVPGATLARLARLRSDDLSDVTQLQQERRYTLSSDQIKAWLYLRNEYAAQFGFAFEIDPNLESILTGEIASLIIPLRPGHLNTRVKQDLWLKLVNNQYLNRRLDSIYRQYVQRLSDQLGELAGGGADILKVTTNTDIILMIAGDDTRFIDSLSIQTLNSYFGLSIKTSEELAAWKSFLRIYLSFRRFQLAYDKKIYIRPWSSGETTEFQHLQIDQHYKAVATFLTHKQLPGTYEQRLAGLNNSQEENEAFFYENESGAAGSQKITWELRKEIFEAYMQSLSEEERAAFYDYYDVLDDAREKMAPPPGFSYSQHINDLVSGAIPGMTEGGVGAASTLTKALGGGKKTLKSLNDKAAGAIGKATRALIEKLGPQALAISKALQLLGLDDEKLGKIIEAIALVISTIVGVLGYLITHSVGFMLGAGAGSIGGFIISGGNPVIAAAGGFGGGFTGLAIEKKFFGEGSWLAKTVDNIGGFFSSAGAGIGEFVHGARNFLGGIGGFGAGAAVGGAFGLSALYSTAVGNPGTTGSFLHPFSPEAISGISAKHKASGKICWPGDGLITTDDSGYYAPNKPHFAFINDQPAKNIAIDIGISDAGPIYAPFSGTLEVYVMFTGPFNGFSPGNYAILRGDNGYDAGFFHLHFKTISYWLAKNNKQVNVQDVIAFADNTGNSRGSHLHYEALNGPLSAIIPEEVESVANSSPHQLISHTTCTDNSSGQEINEDFQDYCPDAGAAPTFSPAVSSKMVQKFLPAPLDDDGVTEIKACHRPSQLVIHWSGSGSAEATYQRILQRRRGCAFATDSTQIIQMQPLGTNKIATGICSHQNDISIDIEIAGRCFSLDSDRTGECDNLSAPQPPSAGNLANTVALAKDIMRIYGISCANVKGHYQTAPDSDPRDDPGRQWMNTVFRPAIGCPAQ